MGSLRKVVLFRNGYGLFVRQFTVTGDQTLTFPILTTNMEEIISTLTILDLGGGKIHSISYENKDVLQEPVRDRSASLPETGKGNFLNDVLQGSKVEVKIGEEAFTGRLFPMGQTQNISPEDMIVSLHLDSGSIKVFNLGEVSEIKPLEMGISQKIQVYLDRNQCLAENDYSVISIRTEGEGTRTIQMSYVMSLPSWEMTYRLLLPKEPGKCKGVLQSLAIITNPGSDVWENIDLTLKSSPFICLSRETGLFSPGIPEGRKKTEKLSSLSGAGEGINDDDSENLLSAPGEGKGEAKRHDSYEYHISHPLSVPHFGSVMVPLADEVLECENVLVYNPLDEETYPYCGAIIKNMTRNTLGEGSLMVFQKETFCGRTNMPCLHPGEMHLIRFAESNECEVKSSCRIFEENLKGVTIKAGEMTLRGEIAVRDDYDVQNKTTRKEEMIIEHPHPPSQRLLKPRNPYHSTQSAWRFKITAPPDISIQFQIESVKDNQIIRRLADLTQEEIEDFVSRQILDPEMGQTLLGYVHSLSEIKTRDSSPREREEERKKIEKALREIAYEKNIPLPKEGE